MPTPHAASIVLRTAENAVLIFFDVLLADGKEEWNRSMKRTGSATPD
ncbi:hypothetical protein C8J36_10852 [Rhizobium sp. PP-F2F-G48]|nr:hypothetical protein C8J36_10852 [Rhizobium sp. PP-F2F-G48]